MCVLFGLHGGPLKQRILVRHTQPALAEGICYGRMDLELASTWPREFDRCLAQIPTATCVFSSPSSRCLRLAQALGRRDRVDVQVDERLQELNFGTWEGRAWDDIPRDDIDEWVADPVDHAPGNGESLRMMWVRVLEFREAVLDRCSGNAVIVGHHGPLRALIAQAAGRPMESMLDHQIAWGGVVTLGEPWFDASEPEPTAPR
jgi:alpha-ribazole phosphatase